MVCLTDYGAFVELEQGIEGLIHVSEMSWTKKVKHPSKVLNVGDEIEAGARYRPRGRAHLPRPQADRAQPLDRFEKYPLGSKINGKVRNITDFGAFVEIEEGIDGLVHISDLSWTQRIKHPSEVMKKGDEVEAVVLNIDPENQRISLGFKQLAPTSGRVLREHHVGDLVNGGSSASPTSGPSSTSATASRVWSTSPSWTRSGWRDPRSTSSPATPTR